MRALFLVLLATTGCATLPAVTRAPVIDNVSLGLDHAALYLRGGRCYGEFQTKDGSLATAQFSVTFCELARAAMSRQVPVPDPVRLNEPKPKP